MKRKSPVRSIVIPAYNEERRIGAMLSEYCKHFFKNTELIVVLNACTDRSFDVVNDIAQHYPFVEIINIQEAIGKGGAVREGFRRSRGTLVGFVDADGSTSAQEYERLERMLNGFDGVIGSRWMPGAQVFARTSLIRKVMSRGFVMLTRILFHLPYDDTQCGAKIFQKLAIQKLLPALSIRDMTFDVELLVTARDLGLNIREVPTIWYDRSSSAFLATPLQLVRTSLTMFLSLLKLYFSLHRKHLHEGKTNI